MVRLLDDLVLLKEVDEIDGIIYSASELKRLYPNKIVIIRHTAYIYRDVLCDIAKEATTALDDYIPLGSFIEEMDVSKKQFSARLKFMEKTGTTIFQYIKLSNIYFIKIDEEFKYLLKYFQPFMATFDDADMIVHCKLLGDLKIGFY